MDPVETIFGRDVAVTRPIDTTSTGPLRGVFTSCADATLLTIRAGGVAYTGVARLLDMADGGVVLDFGDAEPGEWKPVLVDGDA